MRVIISIDTWKMFVKFNRKEAAGLANHCFEIEYADDDIQEVINWCIDNTKDLIYFEEVGYDLSQFGLSSLPIKVNVYVKDEDDATLFKLTWVK